MLRCWAPTMWAPFLSSCCLTAPLPLLPQHAQHTQHTQSALSSPSSLPPSNTPPPPPAHTHHTLCQPPPSLPPTTHTQILPPPYTHTHSLPLLDAAVKAREDASTFDTSRLVEFSERLLWEGPVLGLSPLVREPGRLAITDQRVYFQPLHNIAGE